MRRRNSYRLPFLAVFVILAVLALVLAIGGGTNSAAPSSIKGLASVTSSTEATSDTTSTSEGDTSETEAVTTSTTEDTSATEPDTTSTTEDTATTEDTSSESTSTTAPAERVEGGAVYMVEMSGGEVVPAVTTEATGKATFTVDDTGTKVSFTLEVTGVTDVKGSRVHVGAAGSNGSGVVVLLAGRYQEGSVTGQVASGVFDASLLIGPLKDKTIADFVALIKNGQAYLTVGSLGHPEGEIRGQIK